MLMDGDKTDLASLNTALLRIVAQLTKAKGTNTAGECVKAVATLVENVAVKAMAERIARDVREHLSDAIAQMAAASEQLTQAAENEAASTKRLEERWDGMKRGLTEGGQEQKEWEQAEEMGDRGKERGETTEGRRSLSICLATVILFVDAVSVPVASSFFFPLSLLPPACMLLAINLGDFLVDIL
jgi:VIT1/CCC1 family predicted Fe2+/Mn2+ transporter